MADLHDTRVTVETGILPEIIAGLKEVLLRVENGEELGKIASSLEECEDASSCPGVGLISGSPPPVQPTDHITQIACFPYLDSNSDPFLVASSAGHLELLSGIPDEIACAYPSLAKVPNNDRVTAIQVAEELRIAFCATARPGRAGVSVRSLHQDSMLKERAFLPINGDTTTLAVARFAPTVVVAHGVDLSLFDSSTLQPVPGGSVHRNASISCITTFPHAPISGSVQLWDLREKARPIASLQQHTRCVTAVEPLSPVSLLSTSVDASLCLWDLRRPAEPFRSIIPDGRSIISCSVRASRIGAAVATLHGLYYVDFAHLNLAALALASSPTAAEIFPALGWSNSRLYALHLSGSLLLFA